MLPNPDEQRAWLFNINPDTQSATAQQHAPKSEYRGKRTAVSGLPVEIACDPDFLREYFQTLQDNQTVDIEFRGSDSAIVCRAKIGNVPLANSIYVAMPMAIDR